MQKKRSLRSQLMLTIPDSMRNFRWMTCKRDGWDLQAHSSVNQDELDFSVELPLGQLGWGHGFCLFRYHDSALFEQLGQVRHSNDVLGDPDWHALRLLAEKFGSPLVYLGALAADERKLLLLLEAVQAGDSGFAIASKQALLDELRKRVQREALVGEAARLMGYRRLNFLAALRQELLDDFHSV